MEHYRLPEGVPFDNHGRTTAGWTFAIGVCVGVFVAGLGLIFSPALVWTGAVIVLISAVVSFALHLTGRGQPTRLTQTAKSGPWYTN